MRTERECSKRVSLAEAVNKVAKLKRLEEEGIKIQPLLRDTEKEMFDRIDDVLDEVDGTRGRPTLLGC